MDHLLTCPCDSSLNLQTPSLGTTYDGCGYRTDPALNVDLTCLSPPNSNQTCSYIMSRSSEKSSSGPAEFPFAVGISYGWTSTRLRPSPPDPPAGHAH
jgi:hypothetical protein